MFNLNIAGKYNLLFEGLSGHAPRTEVTFSLSEYTTTICLNNILISLSKMIEFRYFIYITLSTLSQPKFGCCVQHIFQVLLDEPTCLPIFQTSVAMITHELPPILAKAESNKTKTYTMILFETSSSSLADTKRPRQYGKVDRHSKLAHRGTEEETQCPEHPSDAYLQPD